jgi:hypothetical protein
MTAVGGVAVEALDAAPQDEELPPQERVCGDQRRLPAAQIRQRPGDQDRRGGSRGGQHATAEGVQGSAAGAEHAVQEAGEHVRLLGGDGGRAWTVRDTGALINRQRHPREDAAVVHYLQYSHGCTNQPTQRDPNDWHEAIAYCQRVEERLAA